VTKESLALAAEILADLEPSRCPLANIARMAGGA
jgi:hypothetical protein